MLALTGSLLFGRVAVLPPVTASPGPTVKILGGGAARQGQKTLTAMELHSRGGEGRENRLIHFTSTPVIACWLQKTRPGLNDPHWDSSTSITHPRVVTEWAVRASARLMGYRWWTAFLCRWGRRRIGCSRSNPGTGLALVPSFLRGWTSVAESAVRSDESRDGCSTKCTGTAEITVVLSSLFSLISTVAFKG